MKKKAIEEPEKEVLQGDYILRITSYMTKNKHDIAISGYDIKVVAGVLYANGEKKLKFCTQSFSHQLIKK